MPNFMLHNLDTEQGHCVEYQHISIARDDFACLARYGKRKISTLVLLHKGNIPPLRVHDTVLAVYFRNTAMGLRYGRK